MKSLHVLDFFFGWKQLAFGSWGTEEPLKVIHLGKQKKHRTCDKRKNKTVGFKIIVSILKLRETLEFNIETIKQAIFMLILMYRYVNASCI